MEEKIRKSGIGIIGDVPWGSHMCQFYKNKKDLISVLLPYFKAGLENNELCVWITSVPLRVDDAIRSLKKEVKNLDDYFLKHQIEIYDYCQWYTKSGVFEADKVLDSWIKKEEQALKGGFDGLRLSGDTMWLEKKDWKNFSEYEEKVNNTLYQHNVISLCTYSLDQCGASEIIEVTNNHGFALIMRERKWTVIENIEHKRAEGLLKSREQITKFTSHLQMLREKERKLIAKDIHDDVAQVLVSLKMDLYWLNRELPKDQKLLIEKIQSMTEVVDSSLQKAKKMYTELRPSLLNHLGLVAAIKWQAEEFQKSVGIKCEVTTVPEEITLDWERSTTIFRIFQETLANVARHADATRVMVSLVMTDAELKFEVKDNGKGIIKKQITDPKSYGIIEMRERAGFLDAEFSIKGIPGKGTTVKVKIPFETE